VLWARSVLRKDLRWDKERRAGNSRLALLVFSGHCMPWSERSRILNFSGNSISAPVIEQLTYLCYRKEVVEVDDQRISKEGSRSVILCSCKGVDTCGTLRD
jgi:hypothetical protein